MKTIEITKWEAGQRLDKFLGKYMRLAPRSFFYKMLRKKNIVLNGKKADGSERLSAGDCLTLYLSEETIGKFVGDSAMDREPVFTVGKQAALFGQEAADAGSEKKFPF